MNYVWDFNIISLFIPAFLKGLWVTFYVSIYSIIFGSILGVIIAVWSRSRIWILRVISNAYIYLFLAFPVLVLLVWIYFCLPVFLGVSINSEWTAVIALALSLSGFIGDIVRGGIDSIPKGQVESAITLGLSHFQIMKDIILPQAIRIMVAPILGQYITCIKLSALASVIAVYELLHTANNIISNTYRPLEIYTFIAILYLIFILPLVLFMRLFENRSVRATEAIRKVLTMVDFRKWFPSA
jgi:polar amino acid transport system permease protein